MYASTHSGRNIDNNIIYRLLPYPDSERKDELPKMQVGFIDVICVPLYRMLSDTFPWIRPLYDGTMDNRKHWQDLAEKVEMGLTWIDHDTIDKPVEEFAGECPKVNAFHSGVF